MSSNDIFRALLRKMKRKAIEFVKPLNNTSIISSSIEAPFLYILKSGLFLNTTTFSMDSYDNIFNSLHIFEDLELVSSFIDMSFMTALNVFAHSVSF